MYPLNYFQYIAIYIVYIFRFVSNFTNATTIVDLVRVLMKFENVEVQRT